VNTQVPSGVQFRVCNPFVRAADLGDTRVVRLCEVAQSEEYRRAVAAVPGYDAAGSGDIRYDRDETLRPAG